MISPPPSAAKPMAADWIDALSDRKVPLSRGWAADEIRAMPGIMRPLITVNRLVEINSKAHKGKPLPTAKAAADLLRFTRVHLEIARIQSQVAAEQGCRFWSMLDAMDGAGGAYRWVGQSPALMARDLIHFTVPGYQRLAQRFAQDMGWQADQMWPDAR